ncbi:hypothetical protein [Mycobacterium sp.]|uniref:hypothetical protein n=1 Tax=Mycobacterium sp. TaxID=1785 RepID=UPI002BE0265A|nr:hypothetical protein [Mycobacterium sp.]HTH91922.1 hypothetical protein [Mycobacterium sp.]
MVAINGQNFDTPPAKALPDRDDQFGRPHKPGWKADRGDIEHAQHAKLGWQESAVLLAEPD